MKKKAFFFVVCLNSCNFALDFKLTLLGAPLMARWFGPLAPISAGGATTMDTTLPILSQTVGQRYIALSIYHGFVVDFTVPFLVSWWCMV